MRGWPGCKSLIGPDQASDRCLSSGWEALITRLCRRFSISWLARYPGMWSQVGLGSITTNKVSGGDGISAELFQILKDDTVKVLHSICQKIWKTQQWPQNWKRSVFFPIPKKGNAKECSNDHTIALISHVGSNVQNSPSQASTVHEPWTFRCSSWF